MSGTSYKILGKKEIGYKDFVIYVYKQMSYPKRLNKIFYEIFATSSKYKTTVNMSDTDSIYSYRRIKTKKQLNEAISLLKTEIDKETKRVIEKEKSRITKELIINGKTKKIEKELGTWSLYLTDDDLKFIENLIKKEGKK